MRVKKYHHANYGNILPFHPIVDEWKIYAEKLQFYIVANNIEKNAGFYWFYVENQQLLLSPEPNDQLNDKDRGSICKWDKPDKDIPLFMRIEKGCGLVNKDVKIHFPYRVQTY